MEIGSDDFDFKTGDKLPVESETLNALQRNKYITIINKILNASSIDTEIKRILNKLLNRGNKSANENERKQLYSYAEKILEKNSLDELFKIIGLDKPRFYYSYKESIDTLKFFLLNQNEREYLDKIKLELDTSEKLDVEIKEVSSKITVENSRTIMKEMEMNPTTKKLATEIESFENKLEKAHQKLNSTVFYNTQLREKIDLLRKEKKIVEDIYVSLSEELEEKRDLIENTILEAGRANINRNIAENQLKELIEKAKTQKEEFEREYQTINEEIEKDKKFCDFLKEKQKDRLKLEQLEREIKKNQEYIKEKRRQNEKFAKEFEESEKRDLELKKVFQKIKEETGVNQCEELLPLYMNLHDKHKTITIFVEEIARELETVDQKILEVKEEIKVVNLQGSFESIDKQEQKLILTQKIEEENMKYELLKAHEEKAFETIQKIKDYLIELFESLNIPEPEITQLKSTALNSSNLIHFFGLLEEKGMRIIADYSRLISEQIKNEKGEFEEANEQVHNLMDIIEFEHKENSAEAQRPQKTEFPEYLLDFEGNETVTDSKFKNYVELKQQAFDEMNRVLKLGKNNFSKNSIKKSMLVMNK